MCCSIGVLYVFVYVIDEDDDSEEFDYNIDKPFKSSLELTFPVVCIDWMESGYDRMGEMTICCVDYVELKEFNK